MKVYVLRWGVAGDVDTQSVHSTLEGVKTEAMTFVYGADDDDADPEVDELADEARDGISQWNGEEPLELETTEDHWMHIEAFEVEP